MSYKIDENGGQIWDSSSEFNAEELAIINLSGVTVPKLRAFYERFPEQTLETAIGGCIMEMHRELTKPVEEPLEKLSETEDTGT